MRKQNKREIVYSGSLPHDNSIDGFKDWLDSLVEKIPEQWRDSATIDFEEYDGSFDIEISYWRDETDDEARMRRQKNERDAVDAVRRAEAHLARLKARLSSGVE